MEADNIIRNLGPTISHSVGLISREMSIILSYKNEKKYILFLSIFSNFSSNLTILCLEVINVKYLNNVL